MMVSAPHLAWLHRSIDQLRFAPALLRTFQRICGLATAVLLGRRTDRSSVVVLASDESSEPSGSSVPNEIEYSASAVRSVPVTTPDDHPRHPGALIVNADDWGRDRENTDRIFQCVLRGAVSSVSAMVFMEDSERAAAMAQKQGIDTGLHLNLTSPFSASSCPSRLAEHQHEISRHLLRHRYSQVIYHPGLIRSFEYVVSAQLDEFCRVYGSWPERLDGHHHMHLCANVLLGQLLPSGTVVRRNSSFLPGEKGVHNRLYRKFVDRMLARRHRLTDLLYSLSPIEPTSRLQRIFACARQNVVELETHPVKPEEYRFLAGGEILRLAGDIQIAPRFTVADKTTRRGK